VRSEANKYWNYTLKIEEGAIAKEAEKIKKQIFPRASRSNKY
jgi:hypothetical protein